MVAWSSPTRNYRKQLIILSYVFLFSFLAICASDFYEFVFQTYGSFHQSQMFKKKITALNTFEEVNYFCWPNKQKIFKWIWAKTNSANFWVHLLYLYILTLSNPNYSSIIFGKQFTYCFIAFLWKFSQMTFKLFFFTKHIHKKKYDQKMFH